MSDAPAASAPGYLLVQGKVTDLEGFKAYNAALPPIYKQFGGHYIALVPAPKVELAEGEARNESILIAKFPSKEAAWGFWKSAEYAAAKKLREGKGTFFVTVLEGLPGT
ncbi:MAG: DUF1330 domain-containing protein [Gammaproteobacteria bacterium]|nr:DUF1330 domain-containing protein [Gammaproteobacteria bacterium]MBM4210666.1 DUF1330 domain-containing protein [Gammaproteobacteria bacterium]MBM4214012.1 DUF1330 domain-containing protein [Gammaproteobacteria bacterium]